MDQLAKRNFIKTATAFLSASAKHFVSKLALDNTVLRDAPHFQPSFRQCQFLPSVISRLAMVCANVFGEEQMRKIFRLKQGATKFDLWDTIKLECHEYQTENIPQSYYTVQEQPERGRNQTSYWKSAYEVTFIDLGDASFKEENLKRIDQYWYKVYDVHKMVILAILSPIYCC